MSSTSNYGLQKLEQGGKFSDNSYKYTSADRDTIDRILNIGATSHVHDGAENIPDLPSEPPILTLDTTTGVIPPSTRVYYKYTFVDALGNESTPSAEAFIDTPSSLSIPQPPSLIASATGGSLLPGTYSYVMSAWETLNTQETRAINPTSITIPSGSANKITVTFPSLPAGAGGFNLYRKGPGDLSYWWLASSGGSNFVDDGSTAPSTVRTLPGKDTSNASNAIVISLPGATPSVPSGSTWKIYRSYRTGDYQQSLLHHVREESSPGVITTYYEDVGAGTITGTPPSTIITIPSPQPIDLTDSAEVQGTLPPGRVAVYPYLVEWTISGAAATGSSVAYWVNEFESAEIVGVQAICLDPPDSQSFIADVNYGTLAGLPTPTATVFSTQANRPTITTGNYYSSVTVPDVTSLTQGQVLYLDVDQDGGGGASSAQDVKVFVRLHVSHSSLLSTPTWT